MMMPCHIIKKNPKSGVEIVERYKRQISLRI